jgi:uncharacterized membrane protein SpoIIM required for sporulation
VAEALPAFVQRRQADWKAFEGMLERQRSKKLTLDELSVLERLYRKTSADLAAAQTHYAGTDVHRFLNQLAAQGYGAIYRARPDRVAALKDFFVRGFPEAVRETLPYTAVAGALMILGVIVGATTVMLEPSGAALLVPEHLLELIHRHELWTDKALEANTPSEMATQIFTNNLRVTISAFALGITGGIGTVLLLVFNGLHLGSVIAACGQEGLGWGLGRFLLAHGPVELSVIAITGGGGLVIGHALIDPGERPRGEVLRERSSVAVRLLLGCAPFLTAIGVVEGFISPGTFFWWPLKAVIGAALGTAFWLYVLRAGRERAVPR